MEVKFEGKKYEVPAPATIEQKNGELYVNGIPFNPSNFTEVK